MTSILLSSSCSYIPDFNKDDNASNLPDGYTETIIYEDTVDSDGDGLSNLEEKNLGTNPLLLDSDGDGLTDYEEHVTYGTDPLNADSDNDNINDYNEIALSLNPLVKDKSSDTRSLTLNTDSVLMEITGKGNIATTQISKEEVLFDCDGVLDSIYSFSTDGKLKEADVYIPFNEADLGIDYSEGDRVSLYYINPKTDNLEEVPVLINPDDHYIKATLTHFSNYVIGKSGSDSELSNIIYSKIKSYNDDEMDFKGILMADSGFRPEIDGFSFSNFSTNENPGHCYGMATFAELYYRRSLPLTGKTVSPAFIGNKFDGGMYDLRNTYFQTGGPLNNYVFQTPALDIMIDAPLSDHTEYLEVENDILVYKEPYRSQIVNSNLCISTPYNTTRDADYQIKNYGNTYSTCEHFIFSYVLANKDEALIDSTDLNLLNAIYIYFNKQNIDSTVSSASNLILSLRHILGKETLEYVYRGDEFIKLLKYRLSNGDPVTISSGFDMNDAGNPMLHAVNAYALYKDVNNSNLYHIAVYDNNYPDKTRYVDVKCSGQGCVTSANAYYNGSDEPIRITSSEEYDDEFIDQMIKIDAENNQIKLDESVKNIDLRVYAINEEIELSEEEKGLLERIFDSIVRAGFKLAGQEEMLENEGFFNNIKEMLSSLFKNKDKLENFNEEDLVNSTEENGGLALIDAIVTFVQKQIKNNG